MSGEFKPPDDIALWPPEGKALAAQWLVKRRLESLRKQMPPDIFRSWALCLDSLLAPLEMIVAKKEEEK